MAHPLYDNFGEPIPERSPCLFREKGVDIGDNDKVVLFFGFIRKYKGLDIALQAMADQRMRDLGIKLLVAGEFYEDAAPYRD